MSTPGLAITVNTPGTMILQCQTAATTTPVIRAGSWMRFERLP
jgi:hypothetical protein